MSSLNATRSALRCGTCSRSCCSIASSYRSGYGSAALSPPLTVSQLPLLQEGHGGRCCVEPTWISLPQFVQRYVPAETSLPAGTGLATSAPFGWLGPSFLGAAPKNAASGFAYRRYPGCAEG